MKRLNYISSSGSQYIKTGIKPNGMCTVKIKAKINTATSNWDTFFGTRNSDRGRFTIRFENASNGKLGIQKSSAPTNYYTGNTQSIRKNNEAMSWHTYQLGLTYLYDDTELYTYRSTNTSEFPYELFLFCNNNAGSPGDYSYADIEYCKIWDENGNLIRDLVGALDDSNVVCMYDYATNTFFYNQGTGDFTSGGVAETTYFLLQDSNKYYSIINGTLTELTGTFSKLLFETYGMSTPPAYADYSSLTAPYILCWSDVAEKDIQTKTIGQPTYPQAVISEAISLTGMLGIENVIATCEGEPVFAVSVDDGTTWKMWNSVQSRWDTISQINAGMTATELNSVATSNWNTLIASATSIKIRFTLLVVADKVTNVILNYILS